MSLKLIHTSDWHLGHTLRDWSREEEHSAFLTWLTDTIATEDVDALVVAGDLFDTSNPSAASQKQFYSFLARLREQHPRTGIVLVGGNHDSGARLDAPEPLLSSLRIQVVGSLPYQDIHRSLETLDLERILVPLRNREGQVEAWLAAVPFLREADLPPVEVEGEEALVHSIRALYSWLTEAMEKRREPGQALLATGHCYVSGSELSPNSERKIQGGNQALPLDIFPESLAYVALGHLHRPQPTARKGVHYSGAPLPFSLDEHDYGHRIQVVEIQNGTVERRSIRIPCFTEILIKPSEKTAFTVEEAEVWLEQQPELLPDEKEWKRPFLELRVLNARRQPALWERFSRLLKNRRPRLIKLTDVRPEGEVETEDSTPQLSELEPTEVFQRRWRQIYRQQEMPSDVLQAFHELLEEAQRGES